MAQEWPETVQEAILWHHEAEVAAVRAKRAFEMASEAALDRRKFPGASGTTTGGVREVAVERAALDEAELEEAKRWRWTTFVIARETRSR